MITPLDNPLDAMPSRFIKTGIESLRTLRRTPLGYAYFPSTASEALHWLQMCGYIGGVDNAEPWPDGTSLVAWLSGRKPEVTQ